MHYKEVVWPSYSAHCCQSLQGYSSYYPPDGISAYRFFKWTVNDDNRCWVAEMQLHGVMYSDDSANIACDATIQVPH